jgi:hypothetical protein
LNNLDDIGVLLREPNTLLIEVKAGQNRAAAMANVMKLIADSDLNLQTIGAGQSDTEQVYLQLLQEDRAHGFRRFDLQEQQLGDAVPGDPRS